MFEKIKCRLKKSPVRRYLEFLSRIINPIVNPINLLLVFPRYIEFARDLLRYMKLDEAEPFHLLDVWPCLYDKTEKTPFDKHYFYQDIWAFERVYESKVSRHVDVGSRAIYVGMLTTITNVVFIDIRPLEANLMRFEFRKGNILNLPYEDDSIESLSCLNVAEHIGLGRYGDDLDPLGTVKAARELTRVLAKNGNLYFSVPVGKPKLWFNGCRIHSPMQIIQYFERLDLIELSGIDDQGEFVRNIDVNVLENSDYACGLFWFRKT